MTKPILGYWDIRGLVESARLMLEYNSVDYEDKRYRDPNIWFKEKFSLGLDFPNLPYFFDGEVKLSESMAILKYVGKKYNLLPKNDAEKMKCDVAEGVLIDFRGHFTIMCYMPDNFEANKKKFFDTTLPAKMELFEKYFDQNKWVAGESLTYLDFALCEFLDHVRLMEPSVLNKYKNVNNYVERFFNLEKVAAYRQSSRFQKFPINGKSAKWGGNKE